MTALRPQRILIAGGGLGGLTLAVALLRRGFGVRVYEQAPGLGEVGAGLTLATTAMRVMDAIGLWRQVRDVSTHGMGLAFVHYRTGELLSGRFDPEWSRKPDSPEEAAHAHRADVHALLAETVRALDPDALRLGKRLTAVEQDERGVRARFDDGDAAEGELLVGADGVRSAAYRAAFRTDNPATFTGVAAIRCLMPITEAIAPFLSGGRAVNYVGPGRNFHRYGVRDGTVLNSVALVTTDVWREEGWTNPCSREDFMALYADFHPDVRGLIAHAPEPGTFKWALYAREPLASWTNGRVTLLGDAAHPMLPYLGQGATAAIEDALVLARALEAQDRLEDALASYEADRLARTAEQMQMSRRQGEVLNQGPDRYAAEAPDQAALSRYDPRRVQV